MEIPTQIECAELEFMSRFKEICQNAKGDLETITKHLNMNSVSIKPEQKTQLESSIQAQFFFAGHQSSH